MTPQPAALRTWIHAVYMVSLIFLLVNRYVMFSALSAEITDHTFGRVLGANMAYLLIWALAYRLSLRAPHNTVLLILGLLAVAVSLYSAPLVGYGFLIVMAVLGRRQRNRPPVRGGKSPPLGKAYVVDRIAPYRVLAILFWGLLFAYIFYPIGIIPVAMAVVLVLFVLARRYPVAADITAARILMRVTRGDTRDVNEMIAKLPRVVKAEAAELNQMVQIPNPYLREAVLDELRKKGDAETAAILLEMAPRLDDQEMVSLIDTLGHLLKGSQTGHLMPYLKHPNAHIRQRAARHLGRQARAAATEPLAAALAAETDRCARKAQFEALLRLDAARELADVWPQLPAEVRKDLTIFIRREGQALPPHDATVERLMALETDPAVSCVFTSIGLQKVWADTRRMFPGLDTSREAHKSVAGEAHEFNAHLPARLRRQIAAAFPEIDLSNERVDLRLGLAFEHQGEDDESTDVVRAEIHLLPPGTPLLTVLAYFSAEDLFEAVADGSGAEKSFLAAAPRACQTAFDQALLAENLFYFDDVRDVVDVTIDSQRFPIRRKYFTCRTDLAILNDASHTGAGPRLLMRFKGVMECEDYEELPPYIAHLDLLGFLCEPRELLPYNDETEESGPLTSPQIKA